MNKSEEETRSRDSSYSDGSAYADSDQAEADRTYFPIKSVLPEVITRIRKIDVDDNSATASNEVFRHIRSCTYDDNDDRLRYQYPLRHTKHPNFLELARIEEEIAELHKRHTDEYKAAIRLQSGSVDHLGYQSARIIAIQAEADRVYRTYHTNNLDPQMNGSTDSKDGAMVIVLDDEIPFLNLLESAFLSVEARPTIFRVDEHMSWSDVQAALDEAAATRRARVLLCTYFVASKGLNRVSTSCVIRCGPILDKESEHNAIAEVRAASESRAPEGIEDVEIRARNVEIEQYLGSLRFGRAWTYKVEDERG